MNKIIFLLIFFLAAKTVVSQSELAQKVMVKLPLNSDTSLWETDLIIEKKVPYTENETVLILPEITSINEGLIGYKIWIVIVESSTGNIKNKSFLNLESDAVALKSFELDFAAYQISTENRAFGLRTSFAVGSQVNPYSYKSLTLFVREEDDLRIVLNDFIVNEFIGEWDANCAGEFHNQEKILVISSKASNGYYNITVNNNITTTNNFIGTTGECESIIVKTKEKSVLIYSKGSYK